MRLGRARMSQVRSLPQATMPRFGEPGTVTPEQLEHRHALGFEPSAHWSREEAELILHAVAYLREVLLAVKGPREAPIDLQNRLLVFILGDAELREAVRGWSGERPPGRDALFERVAAVAR